VNAKLRRLRIATLSSVCRLGVKRGYLTLAVSMASYACDLEFVGEDGYIGINKSRLNIASMKGDATKTATTVADRAEEALQLFHNDFDSRLGAAKLRKRMCRSCCSNSTLL
jgi:hypothetical protein